MFFIVFESTTPASRTAIATEYYLNLQALLQTQSGFISEIPFASPVHAHQQVLIAKWTDEAGVHTWRTQHDHLQIQHKAREGVFDAYRLRVGPDVLSSSASENEDEEATTKHKGHFVVLYEGPVLTTSVAHLTDLVDSPKSTPADVTKDVVDAAVYQGAKSVLWISAWPTMAAAVRFERSIDRAQGDSVDVIRVVRDYGGTDRDEAPKGADAAQAASVVGTGHGAGGSSG